jgi:hypothetical protein
MRKVFNFCHKAQKLLRYISRDSGDSPDSNHTKYTNYESLDLKEISIIFPSLRDAQEKTFPGSLLRKYNRYFLSYFTSIVYVLSMISL